MVSRRTRVARFYRAAKSKRIMTANLLTVGQACEALPSKPTERWLDEFLRQTKCDPYGYPLYRIAARQKLVYFDRPVDAKHVVQRESEQPREEAQSDGGFVYFIRAGDFIKIGYSRSIRSRLIKMATDVPMEPEVLHVEPGTFRTEKVLHRQFASFRMRGEWFRAAPELLAFIEQRKLVREAT
jgi:hypothetical protein